MLSPGDGFKWLDKDLVIGKTLAMDMPADEIIYPNMLQS
jgi:sialic acid synthase